MLLTRDEWLKRSISKGRQNGDDSRGGCTGRDRSKVRCFNYLTYGHYAAECRKAKVNMSQTTDEPTLLMAEYGQGELFLNEQNVRPGMITEVESNRGVSNIYYLDNGASNHMTGHRSKFSKLDEKVTGKVRFGDGSTVDIKGKVTVTFKCKNGGEKSFCEVYYIPNLRNNIISLGQLTKNGNKVILNGDWLWIYVERGRILMKVKKLGNKLYKMLENYDIACLLTKTYETSWLWHKRLGHVNF